MKRYLPPLVVIVCLPFVIGMLQLVPIGDPTPSGGTPSSLVTGATEGNATDRVDIDTTYTYCSQAWSYGSNVTITKYVLRCRRYDSGSLAGNMTVMLRTDSGGEPCEAVADTTVTVDVDTIGTSTENVDFTLASPYSYTASTALHLYITAPYVDDANKMAIYVDGDDPAATFQYKEIEPDTPAPCARDFGEYGLAYFEIWGY